MENLRRHAPSDHTLQVGVITDSLVASSNYYLPPDDGQEGTIVAFDAETAARRRHQGRSNREVQARMTVAPLVTAGTIVEIYNAGNSLEETADRLGVTRGDVRRALAQEEVGVRDRKTAARVSWRDEVKEARVAKVHTPESDALRKERSAFRSQDPERKAELRRYYHEKFLKNVAEVFGQDPKSRIEELLANGGSVDVAVQLGIPLSFLTRAQKHFGVVSERPFFPRPHLHPEREVMFYRLLETGREKEVLTPRQLEVYHLRYGKEPKTQEEIARMKRINRQSVQQVEKGGAKRMEPIVGMAIE